MAMRDPVTIIPAEDESIPDPDQEASFDEFREKLKTSQEQGRVRVFRVPMDERNQPMITAKVQSELFTAPIDLYSFEEIINKIRREFLRPDQSIMAARLHGTKMGHRGAIFNKIVMIERPNFGDQESPVGKESLAGILKVIQESTERQQAFMQAFFERLADARTNSSIMPTNPMEIAKGMIEAVSGLMAAVNKPAQIAATVATPATSLKDMMESMILMRDLAQDFAGTGEKEDTAVGIARAVAQVAQPIANALADKSRASTVMELRRRALPAPKRPSAASANHPLAPPAPNVSAPLPKKPPSEEVTMLNQIRPHLDALCDMAQGDPPADPVEVAGLVMDFVPDNFDDALWKLVSSPRFVKNLALLNNRVREHAEFFEKVRVAIMAEFAELDEAETDSIMPARNSAEEPGTPVG